MSLLPFEAAKSGGGIDPKNYLKFRARLDNSNPADVHRDFTGTYYPRWRSMYLEEIKERKGEVRLLPVYDLGCYLTPQGDYYMTDDFTQGSELSFGNVADDSSHSGKVKRSFVVTFVDKSHLQVSTATLREHFEKHYPADAAELILRVRDAFVASAGGDACLGIKSIGRKFRAIDDDGNRKVSPAEFYKAVVLDEGIEITQAEVERVFAALDKDDDGHISFEELLMVMRGPMSERRKMLVVQAFRKIDYNGDGVLSVQDIKTKYNAKAHPEVQSGAKSEQQILRDFLLTWDTRDRNGTVTLEEFQDYYHGVSACIDDDDYFEAVIRTAWCF